MAHRRLLRHLAAASASIVSLCLAVRPSAAQQTNPFAELSFRSIGPAVTGGRIHDVQALPDDPGTIWVASATGGLWKSTNRGTTWDPVFDGQPTGTFGVVAVAPSNHDVVWAGTGEQNNRQSSSWGNGVYRSTDGGETWTHVGLEDTRAIGRILVDPADPDVALVGALGNLWAPSEERGVFRTTDGGRTWTKVLYVDDVTGVVDMARDGGDPGTIYAAAYQRLRQPWGFNGGGPGSGIYRSTDGGQTWERLTRGLPDGPMGRIGVATSAHTGGLVYAVVEHATAQGIYRSTDGGDRWERMSDMNSRPAYYSGLYVDPTDDARLYLCTRWFYQSEDAGRTWRTMPTEPTYDVGLKGDYHAMWIDPNDSRHFYLAGDGGLYQTWDRGATYVPYENIPIGQFYGLGLDDRAPYWIYGGMQDNHSWEVPSATRHYLGIVGDDWREIGFNDGLEHDVDVDGPRYVYSNAVEGDLTLVDAYTGDRREIPPVAEPGQPELRWEWMTPGAASRTMAGTYYYGAQRLMITRNHGTTWTGTEDLTRNIDRDTLSIMGVKGSEPMLSKNDGQSDFSALSAVAESPLDARILWVGSDDGNLQVSRDGGATWTEVVANLPGAPDGAYISRIGASREAPGVAYVAVDDHRRGDFRPYAYRTEDFGATWTSIAGGLPADGSVRFIGEHPNRPGALFLGTEHALYASPDRGGTWYPLGTDLPATPYMEVEVQPRTHDAVVATHGRGIYILDDASSLAEWTPEVGRQPAHLFSIRPSHIWQYWEDKSYRGQDFWAGENPKEGAVLDYVL
ncbi:MAG: glycosyl hydrolase, partial [Gemmatimonadota bacterium]